MENFLQILKHLILIHNGLEEINVLWSDRFKLISLQRIIDEWNIWKELFDAGEFKDPEDFYSNCQLDRVIKIDYCWNCKWIPIACNGSGDNYCLDLDPDVNGNYGQIITLWHDSNDRELIAVNFRSWLEKIAADLENGVYIYDPKYKWLEPVDL